MVCEKRECLKLSKERIVWTLSYILEEERKSKLQRYVLWYYHYQKIVFVHLIWQIYWCMKYWRTFV